MIGEVVLFRIHEDPVVDRPLLVVTDKSGILSGELFLDWEEDRPTLWIQKNAFYMPHKDLRTLPVQGVHAGHGLGEWHRRVQS